MIIDVFDYVLVVGFKVCWCVVGKLVFNMFVNRDIVVILECN